MFQGDGSSGSSSLPASRALRLGLRSTLRNLGLAADPVRFSRLGAEVRAEYFRMPGAP